MGGRGGLGRRDVEGGVAFERFQDVRAEVSQELAWPRPLGNKAELVGDSLIGLNLPEDENRVKKNRNN